MPTKKRCVNTVGDEGAYLLAIVSAYRLGLISRADGLDRGGRVLDSLNQMPLFVGRLPNKAYNTTTLQMTDYANRPTPNGVGWSALDIMRMVTGLLVLSNTFPELEPQSRAVLGRWDLSLLARNGRFQANAVRVRATGGTLQEGRIGYEQYAATAGLLIGLPVKAAAKLHPILRYQTYQGIRLPGDIRTADTHGVSSITTSEPFILLALEFGWQPDVQQVAQDVYRAQIFRYAKTGHLTALSEGHIKGKPYFAYNSVLVDHQPFVTVTADRTDVSDKRSLSTKASFGWWAIFRDPYSEALIDRVRYLQSDRGWYAGVFESTGLPNKALSLNTNAVILEALHYKALGPLFRR